MYPHPPAHWSSYIIKGHCSKVSLLLCLGFKPRKAQFLKTVQTCFMHHFFTKRKLKIYKYEKKKNLLHSICVCFYFALKLCCSLDQLWQRIYFHVMINRYLSKKMCKQEHILVMIGHLPIILDVSETASP